MRDTLFLAIFPSMSPRTSKAHSLRLCWALSVARPGVRPLSDATCTSLQLANFWPDVIVDLEKERVYVHLDIRGAKHQLPLESLFALRLDGISARPMKESVNR